MILSFEPIPQAQPYRPQKRVHGLTQSRHGDS